MDTRPDYNLNKTLNKSITVSALERPIKIAYIVPYEESKKHHCLLDEIFDESYSRWAGVKTLIIPSSKDKFLKSEYENWLSFYDPDFIYSYINLDKKLIEKIDQLCCPIRFILHRSIYSTDECDYVPKWNEMGIKHMPSIGTIYSLYNMKRHQNDSRNAPLLVVTKNRAPSEKRFISDNFGTFYISPNSPMLKNLFETICLTSDRSEQDSVRYGNHHKTSELDIFSTITRGILNEQVITFYDLAIAHSSEIPTIETHRTLKGLNIIFGKSCIDRINFWNFRNLTQNGNINNKQSVLIINPTLLEENNFIETLGEYLDLNNCRRQNHGRNDVILSSLILDEVELKGIACEIKEKTRKSVHVAKHCDFSAMPTKDEIEKNHHHYKQENTSEFKLVEKINKLEAKTPSYFTYIPKQFHATNQGQLAVDLEIERHNSFSKYTNIIDKWMLPRRISVTQCFTNNLSKVSKNHLLTVVPGNPQTDLSSDYISMKYELILPEDAEIFQYLVQEYPYILLNSVDMRVKREELQIEPRELEISDKGQNLRGVISMFKDVSEAHEYLTNKFWREVFKSYKKKRLTYEKIHGIHHNLLKDRKKVSKELRMDKKGFAKYIEANLKDSLESLVEKKIFFQVHIWRCHYCGHRNVKSIDEIKKKNVCEICREVYYAPIDLKWMYQFNSFVVDTLYERSGLAVLWTVGYLLENKHPQTTGNGFYFLPEVNLCCNKNNLQEIDLLCIKNGKFILGEIKKSSMNFTDSSKDEIQKFIKKINLLMPDIAILAFEQYSENNDDRDLAIQELISAKQQIKEAIPENVEIKSIIASENDPDFSNFSVRIPIPGMRTQKL